MVEAQKDPFEEISWGALRYKAAGERIVSRALGVMNTLGKMFPSAEAASPKLEFVPGGELPILGQFITPLGTAEVRLLMSFGVAARPHDFDPLYGTIVVFAQEPGSVESRFRQVDWCVDVSQYDAVTARSGSYQRELSGQQVGHFADMNYYQSGMALYRAIVEVK